MTKGVYDKEGQVILDRARRELVKGVWEAGRDAIADGTSCDKWRK